MMVSPSSLMEGLKRSGWGGRRRLVPFFKCVCVYWAVGGGGGGGEAAAKCAPVLWLAGSVAHAAAAGGPRAPLRRRVALGLALSALGDALLVWPRGFVPGMAAFGGAHVAYTAAFGGRGRGARLAPAPGALLYAATAAFVAQLRPAGALRALVPLYAALLATMAWRAVAAAPRPAALGALLFLLSDAILAYSLFREPLPYRRVLVMSTYYLGQLGIALGALEADAPPPPPPPLPPAATPRPAVAAH